MSPVQPLRRAEGLPQPPSQEAARVLRPLREVRGGEQAGAQDQDRGPGAQPRRLFQHQHDDDDDDIDDDDDDDEDDIGDDDDNDDVDVDDVDDDDDYGDYDDDEDDDDYDYDGDYDNAGTNSKWRGWDILEDCEMMRNDVKE